MDVQAEVNSLLSTGLLMLIVGVYKYSEVVLAWPKLRQLGIKPRPKRQEHIKDMSQQWWSPNALVCSVCAHFWISPQKSSIQCLSIIPEPFLQLWESTMYGLTQFRSESRVMRARRSYMFGIAWRLRISVDGRCCIIIDLVSFVPSLLRITLAVHVLHMEYIYCSFYPEKHY